MQREDDHAYVPGPDGIGAAKTVLAACREAGLDGAEWVERADVPFPFHGGVRLRDQAQIDPMPLLNSLATELENPGWHPLAGRSSHFGSGTAPVRITLRTPTSTEEARQQQLSITAQKCVLATGIPILDRGGFFARLKPRRSYCLAFNVPGDITRPMFISVDSPTRSVRYALTAEGEQLTVGGAGHTGGRADGPTAAIQELAKWTAVHYPGAIQTHFWSAQDYTPIDER